MDLFGLWSFEAPQHGDRFLLNQTEVNVFIEQANSQLEVRL